MVVDREPFQVIHSKSGKDLTRNVLLQIITEMEEEGHDSLLTNRVLQELIRFYGDRMVGMMAPFLEKQILQYLETQDQLRKKITQAFTTPYPTPEQLIRQMMEQYKEFAEQATTTSKESRE